MLDDPADLMARIIRSMDNGHASSTSNGSAAAAPGIAIHNATPTAASAATTFQFKHLIEVPFVVIPERTWCVRSSGWDSGQGAHHRDLGVLLLSDDRPRLLEFG